MRGWCPVGARFGDRPTSHGPLPSPHPCHTLTLPLPALPDYVAGVGGLLDILLEDSLEGYVACIAFGVGVIWLIRVLKLPVVEGNGLPF